MQLFSATIIIYYFYIRSDNNIFDISSGNWVRDFKYPQTQIPSVQEAYKIFLKDHIKIIESNDTGFVTISIAHKSPFIAKAWTDLVVNEINNWGSLSGSF